MASSVHPDACEEHCVEGILKLTKDRVWAVRVAAAAALPGVARGDCLHRAFNFNCLTTYLS